MTVVYFVNLEGALVNLNGIGLFECHTYAEGMVWGRLYHSGSDKGSFLLRVELETGFVFQTKDDDSDLCFDCTEQKIAVVYRDQMNEIVKPIEMVDARLVKLILNFLTHRVSDGTKIIQGLKLGRMSNQYAITECYVGGWFITQKCALEVKDDIPNVPLDMELSEFIVRIYEFLQRKDS